MLEVSELIYETCKTYLVTQGKFILLLELFVGAIIVLYFGVLLHFEAFRTRQTEAARAMTLPPRDPA